jgi:hypothetical protein
LRNLYQILGSKSGFNSPVSLVEIQYAWLDESVI